MQTFLAGAAEDSCHRDFVTEESTIYQASGWSVLTTLIETLEINPEQEVDISQIRLFSSGSNKPRCVIINLTAHLL